MSRPAVIRLVRVIPCRVTSLLPLKAVGRVPRGHFLDLDLPYGIMLASSISSLQKIILGERSFARMTVSSSVDIVLKQTINEK